MTQCNKNCANVNNRMSVLYDDIRHFLGPIEDLESFFCETDTRCQRIGQSACREYIGPTKRKETT